MSHIFCISYIMQWDCDNEGDLLKWHFWTFRLFVAHVWLFTCRKVLHQLMLTSKTFRWPLLTSLGMLPISPLTIFWCSCLMLKGSTVKGSAPVSMAKVLTPLCRNTKGNAVGENKKLSLLKVMQSDRLHRPDVHLGSVLPVSQQLGGRVGGTAALGAEEFRGQRLTLQSVAQAKVCAKH